jgi:hypothetical protein
MMAQFLPVWLGMAVVGCGLAAAVAEQQPPVIRVPVRLVTAPTLVFSKDGRLIPDLRETDFRVFDNGRLKSWNWTSQSRRFP